MTPAASAISARASAPWLVVAACLAFAVLLLSRVVGPYMRESDQASVLYGAVELANGNASPFHAGFYNYDKQYVSYWIPAVAHRLWPRVDVVVLGNVLGFSIFWCGLATLVLSTPCRRLSQAAATACVIVAPAFWLHTPFYACASVSAGFMFLAFAAWRRLRPVTLAQGAGSLLLLLAIGSRADAVLLLPWFLWCAIPAGVRVRPAAACLVAGAGLVALVLGRLIYDGVPLDFTPPFIRPKVFAAYAVFGLGASALVFVWMAVGIARAAASRWRRRAIAKVVFYSAGLASLLAPLAYYAPQLYSTRYWFVLLCALLGGATSRRGSLLLAATVPAAGRMNRWAGALGFIALGFLPIFVGIHLPFPDRPRLVIRNPTLFPTGDGLQPMGAIHGYYAPMVGNPGYSLDHNHATWRSARAAKLEPDASGRIPVLEFSLRSYLELATALERRPVSIVQPDAPFFYSDARDLLRVYHTGDAMRPADRLALARDVEVVPVAPDHDGHVIVRARPGGRAGLEWLERIAIAHALRGNQYRLLREASSSWPYSPAPLDRGKTLVLFSRDPFAGELVFGDGRRSPIPVAKEPLAGLHVAVLGGRERDGASLAVRSGQPAVACTVHPDYMDVSMGR